MNCLYKLGLVLGYHLVFAFSNIFFGVIYEIILLGYINYKPLTSHPSILRFFCW